MRLSFHIVVTCIIGVVLSHLVASFDVRRRREVPDSPENYGYYVRPFVVPEPVQFEPLLKAQSVSDRNPAKQYKPPLLALPSVSQPAGTGSYHPPIPLLAAVPRPQDPPRQSAPLERKQLRYNAADITELSQSPPERRADAIDNRAKAVGSSRHPSQAIHQVPASEIQSEKSTLAKDRDSAKNDEYVVYYYYYYDNDTNSNNLTLNFDDIPSLDSYDEAKSGKEPAKSASSRSIAANVNALTPAQDQPKDNSQRVATRATPTPKANSSSGASQPRSLSSSDATAVEPVIRADKPDNTLEDTIVQPLKPVSNVFRYGSNEVPRFPVLPNFIVSEVPTEVKSEEQSTQDTLSTPPSTTLPTSTVAGNLADERLQPEVDSDDANNVLDSDTKVAEEQEEKVAVESSTTTTTTTTEPPTTTEIQTTTTEKTRRRPGLPVAGRRRFSGSSAAPPPPPPPRSRQTPTRATSSFSSSTTTTTGSPSSTRSFRGSSSNRLRPRPIGGNRPRTSASSTKPEDNEETGSSKATAESTSTTASRSRFSSTASPRRFAGGRNSASRSTTSTTPSSRLRTTSRPRPNLITRNRPRPGFLRPRPGKEEEPETVETTTPEPEVTEEKTSNSENLTEETEPEDQEESESPDTETPEAEEEETEEPTTTEKSRFAALFRPRNRNGNGNRPRPVIANRPSRSRR